MNSLLMSLLLVTPVLLILALGIVGFVLRYQRRLLQQQEELRERVSLIISICSLKTNIAFNHRIWASCQARPVPSLGLFPPLLNRHRSESR